LKNARALVGLAVLLASCAPREPPQPTAAPPAVQAPPLPRQKPNPPVRKPRPLPPKATEVSPLPEDAPPSADIALIGLSRPEIIDILGEPTDQSDRGTAKSWVYRGPGCSLELTFFFDVSRSDFYALYRRVDGTDGTQAGIQRCLQQLRDMRTRQ
jgi:hypothetical protein